MAKKVFLGVGHGGVDAGAIGMGFREADLNLAIALVCGEALSRHGVSVKLSRRKDENDDINEEIRECNAFKPTLAVDIHNNAGGGDGAEVFYSIAGGKSKTLAQNILDEIVKVGQNSRGIKTKTGSNGDYFGFIRCTKAPAVLVECAFVDSNDVKVIDTKAEQKKMGEAIAKGILATLGIEWKQFGKVVGDISAPCRRRANIKSRVKGRFAVGSKVEILKKVNDNWYRVKGKNLKGKTIKGFVYRKRIKVIK